MSPYDKSKMSRCVLSALHLAAVVAAMNSVRLAGLQLYQKKDYEGALLIYLAAAEEGLEIAQWNAAFLLRSGIVSVPGNDGASAPAKPKEGQEAKGISNSHSAVETFPLKAAKEKRHKQPQLPQQSLVYRQLNRAALQGNVQALREIGLMHAANQ